MKLKNQNTETELKSILDELSIAELKTVEAYIRKRINTKGSMGLIYTSCVDMWFRYYKHKTNVDYSFTGTDGKHIKSIISKLRTHVPEDKKNDHEFVSVFFGQFLNGIVDKWILEHLDIPTINSKFNQLIAQQSKTVQQEQRTKDIFDQWK